MPMLAFPTGVHLSEEVDDDLGELVMAMPRRELFALKGFIQQVSLPVLQSLQDEHWFALPEIINDDLEAKEVRIAC